MTNPDLKQRKYVLVVVDEYTRYAFAFLLRIEADAKLQLHT